jgi:hypothetical protein
VVIVVVNWALRFNMNETSQPPARQHFGGSLTTRQTNPPDSDSPLQTNDLASRPRRGLRTTRPGPQRAIDLSTTPVEERHSRKCHVCNHPDRDLIELDFLQWRSSRAIPIDHEIPENSIYRHAHALGLFELRRGNMRLALDRVIEKCSYAEATADTVVRAVRAQACLTDDGHWVEPARHLIVTTQPARSASTGCLEEAPNFLIESPPIRNAP